MGAGSWYVAMFLAVSLGSLVHAGVHSVQCIETVDSNSQTRHMHTEHATT